MKPENLKKNQRQRNKAREPQDMRNKRQRGTKAETKGRGQRQSLGQRHTKDRAPELWQGLRGTKTGTLKSRSTTKGRRAKAEIPDTKPEE